MAQKNANDCQGGLNEWDGSTDETIVIDLTEMELPELDAEDVRGDA